MVLTPLPDTKGQVKVEGRGLSPPGGFQAAQIKVACPCPSPAQATVGRPGRLTRKKAKSYSEKIWGRWACGQVFGSQDMELGSQKQEGRSCPGPGGGRAGTAGLYCPVSDSSTGWLQLGNCLCIYEFSFNLGHRDHKIQMKHVVGQVIWVQSHLCKILLCDFGQVTLLPGSPFPSLEKGEMIMVPIGT